jgi:transposase-like protein
MAAQRKYPDELRERAVKMVFEIRERDGKGHGELARHMRGRWRSFTRPLLDARSGACPDYPPHAARPPFLRETLLRTGTVAQR